MYERAQRKPTVGYRRLNRIVYNTIGRWGFDRKVCIIILNCTYSRTVSFYNPNNIFVRIYIKEIDRVFDLGNSIKLRKCISYLDRING